MIVKGGRYVTKINGDYIYHGLAPDPDNSDRRINGDFLVENPKPLGTVQHYREGSCVERPLIELKADIEKLRGSNKDVFILPRGRFYDIISGMIVPYETRPGRKVRPVIDDPLKVALD
jgi:hypothetical protein